jgi:hypothetical protein
LAAGLLLTAGLLAGFCCPGDALVLSWRFGDAGWLFAWRINAAMIDGPPQTIRYNGNKKLGLAPALTNMNSNNKQKAFSASENLSCDFIVSVSWLMGWPKWLPYLVNLLTNTVMNANVNTMANFTISSWLSVINPAKMKINAVGIFIVSVSWLMGWPWWLPYV